MYMLNIIQGAFKNYTALIFPQHYYGVSKILGVGGDTTLSVHARNNLRRQASLAPGLLRLEYRSVVLVRQNFVFTQADRRQRAETVNSCLLTSDDGDHEASMISQPKDFIYGTFVLVAKNKAEHFLNVPCIFEPMSTFLLCFLLFLVHHFLLPS